MVLLLLCCAAVAPAQEAEKVRRIGLAVGYSNILDTYLSPENYTGTEFRFVANNTKQKAGKHWQRLMKHEAYFSVTKNRAKTSSELAGMYRFKYGMLYDLSNIINVKGLRVHAGGHATVNAGFLYNMRNENNPAQGRLGLNIGPIASADYGFTLFGCPFALHYEVSAPLLGLMFSPNYGQSYYEIFTQGNYDHNCVPTTIVSTPSLRQSFTIDFKISKASFFVGYVGDYDQYKVNNLKYHNYTHAGVIGYRY
ncbi:MAG: DUF3316 domain-containing protein [Bacteroidaceae bacterium]|nr:DUF3316 domain-containing protein [Bacteroidaceae bacterium]